MPRGADTTGTGQGERIDVVTGASGHLGNVLVRELCARGRRVRALFRTEPEIPLPDAAEPFYCDLHDREGLEKAFYNAGNVYHTAGLVAFGLGSYKSLQRVNVEGTRNVIEAVLHGGARRLVYTSSIEAFDLLSKSFPITEKSPVRPDSSVMPYGKSKALATLEVETAVRLRNLDAVTVFPTGFIGPYDDKMSSMTKVVLDFLKGRIPVGIRGGFDFVDVRDVASGLIGAAEKGTAGERFLLPGHNVSVRELFEVLGELTGKPAPRFQVPYRLSWIWGFLAELFYAVSRATPRYTRKSLEILTLGVRVDGNRARETFGYSPRPLDESIADTLTWLVDRGFARSERE